jgi:hypothetical protein
MTPNRIQAAQKLIAAAEIQSISLVEAKLAREPQLKKETTASLAVPQGRLTVNISHSGRAALEQKGAIRATVRFGLQAREAEEEEAKPAFRVAASFELAYKIPPDLDPSRQELRAFAETNAVFNAWPYWREFAQSMTARMNLPPLTLPLFRIAPSGSERQKTRPPL